LVEDDDDDDDDASVLGGIVRTMRKNTVAIIFPGSEIGLEVIADKTKYMIMS
jgi:hypothetical protein